MDSPKSQKLSDKPREEYRPSALSGLQRFGDFLEHFHPPLFRTLVRPTPEEYAENDHGSTRFGRPYIPQVSPPNYPTLLQWMGVDQEGDAFEEIDRRLASLSPWRSFKHKPTGLLISIPHDRELPGKGRYKSCLKEWGLEEFRQHLKSASSARLKVGSEYCDVYSKLMSRFCSLSTLSDLFNPEHYFSFVENERTMHLTFIRCKFVRFLEYLFEMAVDIPDLHLMARLNVNDDSGPKLSSMQILDTTYEIRHKNTLLGRIIQETRVPFSFPCLWEDLSKERSKAKVLRNLVDFYSSDTGRQTYCHRNVLMQLRMNLGIHHRRFGIVSSLNCWSFVKLDQDGTMHVTKRFMANDCDPYLGMGMLEIMIRFICASIGNEERDTEPIGTMRDRPDFIKEWAKSFAEKPGRSVLLGPRCWADLEDPRRNAKSNDLTFEQHMSPLGTLEGDAKPLGTRKMGWILRKEFNGIDMVIKVSYPVRSSGDDSPSFDSLCRLMENEERIYKKLESLQGDVVPRCFGCRSFGALGMRALATEYVGPAVKEDDNGNVPENQAKSALKLLKRIHEAGVLHGSVRRVSNILWDEKRDCAVLVDFEYARTREEFKREEEWSEEIEKEVEKFCRTLGWKQSQLQS